MAHSKKSKVCTQCNRELPASSFYMNKGKWLSAACIPCTLIRVSKYQSDNRNKKNTYSRAYREKNKQNPKYRASRILENMVSKSKRRGWEPPEFTSDEIAKIIDGGRCEITGIPFELVSTRYNKSPWVPSPDRIDSSLGYTKDNVQWVCYLYNKFKGEFSQEDINLFISELINKYDSNEIPASNRSRYSLSVGDKYIVPVLDSDVLFEVFPMPYTIYVDHSQGYITPESKLPEVILYSVNTYNLREDQIDEIFHNGMDVYLTDIKNEYYICIRPENIKTYKDYLEVDPESTQFFAT